MVSKRGMGSHKPDPHLESAASSVIKGPANPLLKSLWHSAKRNSAASSVGTHPFKAAKAAGPVACQQFADWHCIDPRNLAEYVGSLHHAQTSKAGDITAGQLCVWPVQEYNRYCEERYMHLCCNFGDRAFLLFAQMLRQWLQALGQCDYCLVARCPRFYETVHLGYCPAGRALEVDLDR